MAQLHCTAAMLPTTRYENDKKKKKKKKAGNLAKSPKKS